MTKIGIDAMSFYVPHRYIALSELAEHHGIDPGKFSRGIGQEKIAMPGADEDIVTMAAEAAQVLIDDHGAEGIDTVLFATETGIDQSKAAGIYVHRLLNLPENCRTVELKQACYSATAALQMACGHVARKPTARVLVIASDVARYDRDTSGEPTQGAAAVAMLVCANPGLMEIDPETGCHTEDIMDFWRPNYRRTPLFDGKYSALRYLDAVLSTWRDYQANGGRSYDDLTRFCYHLPFSRMGEKAHRHLAKHAGARPDPASASDGMTYARQVGNCYAASLYLSLISTLETGQDDLTDRAVGLFSYGSGAVAEFFSGRIVAGYRDRLYTARHSDLLQHRDAVSYDGYTELWERVDPRDGTAVTLPKQARGQFRLAGFNEHQRLYVKD